VRGKHVAEFLLEIGCEEIPASWLPGLAEQLRERFTEAAAHEHLDPKDVKALQGPRRLVVAAQLNARQADREENVWGPTLKVAKDAAGQWTNAALGFAKKNGVSVDALQTGSKDGSGKGDPNLLFIKKVAGRDTAQVLTELIGSTLRALNFPKRMNWDAWLEDGKGAFTFGRPIRWMVALFDGKVVPFTIYEMKAGARAGAVVTSGNRTFGHRFLPRGAAGAPVTVSSFSDLSKKLESAFVLLDPAARAGRIQAALAPHLAAGEVHNDHGLPAEWRDLTEYPSVLLGQIPVEFRKLPVAVLETVLVHHQKYVPLMGEGVVVRFAAVVNGDGSNGAEIVRGMERVVTARLRDAAFFYEEDRKRALGDRVEALSGVTFHRELGSYKQKADRMVKLVDAMGESMGLLRKPELESAREAARLCKADLTTLMVREFTELQGVMGGIYLRAEGHVSPHVAAAVQCHYLPVSIEEGSAPDLNTLGDPTVFAAVSIADKLDTLAGYFGIGLVPSGSSDPFGLRRAGQGVIRVLLDFWKADEIERRPSLRKLVQAAIAGYGKFAKRTDAEVAADLETFLLDRLRYVLVSRGYPGDEVDAVLAAKEPDALDDAHEAWVRAKALHAVRSEAREDFEALAGAFKRAKNIVGAQPSALDAALFQEPAERELHAAVQKALSVDGGYEGRLRSLASLRGPVDKFFDDVLVMAEDPKIRANRLGLLSQALSLFYRIADISKLGG
jgi:glycyl-tRNA synthetase beta chain